MCAGGVRQRDLLLHPALACAEGVPPEHGGAAESGHRREDVQSAGDEGEAAVRQHGVSAGVWGKG